MRRVPRRAARLLAAAACVLAVALAAPAEGREVTLTIGDLQAPGFAAQSVSATLTGAKLETLTLDIDRLTAAGR